MQNKIIHKILDNAIPIIFSIFVVIVLPVTTICLDSILPDIIIQIPISGEKIPEYITDFKDTTSVKDISLEQKTITYLLLNNRLFRK